MPNQGNLNIPESYIPRLDVMQTEAAIKFVKDTFERQLARQLNLMRVSAPLFVRPETGLNDDLNGVERPVEFDILDLKANVQIVQSLAKWKRLALRRYGFGPGTGLYTDMNAIRRDEVLDNIHSVYVDQWDWEKTITPAERTLGTLYAAAHQVLIALRATEQELAAKYTALIPFVPDELYTITSQELEDAYPFYSPRERENALAKEHGAVFISQIGAPLRSGVPHDSRAPDYDDWSLNGDLLLWSPVLGRAVEVSSMGVRVDAGALRRQLDAAGCPERGERPFHRMLLSDRLPASIGGGIGQSRICMLLLQKAHIGEVQASVWPEWMNEACEARGIHLL